MQGQKAPNSIPTQAPTNDLAVQPLSTPHYQGKVPLIQAASDQSVAEVGFKLKSWLQAIFMLTLSQTSYRLADPSAAPGPTSSNRKSDSRD